MSGRGRAASWQADRLLVVLDVGKSNAKIVLLDPVTGAEIAVRHRPNGFAEGSLVRELDLRGLEDWLLDTLARLPERQRVGAIVPITHGAACVMLDGADRPVLAPDYEDAALGEETGYEALRDPFERSFSPSLPAGLNLGRQIHFAQVRAPALFSRVASILPYPQYWAFVLSGVRACEVTSLGCHTDLWLPGENRFSGLAERAGWAALFPAIRRADETLGCLLPSVAARCGLAPDCAVLCGIHDSNASYLHHRAHRRPDERFAVISSGTWTVILANGAELGRLDPQRDMLANVDAFGAVVATARFMGGREYVTVAGADAPAPTLDGLSRALASGASVAPSFAAGGQFARRTGTLVRAETLDGPARAALATLYVALLTDAALDLLGAEGDLVVDGPLSRNPLYPGVLAALRPGATIGLGDEAAGPGGGARCLLLGRSAKAPALRVARADGETEALVREARGLGWTRFTNLSE